VSHLARPSRYLAPTELFRRWWSSKDSTPPVALPLPYALQFRLTTGTLISLIFRIGWTGHFGLRFDADLRHLGEGVYLWLAPLDLFRWRWIPHSPLCLTCLLPPYWALLQTAVFRWHCSSIANSQPGEPMANRRLYLSDVPRTPASR
jgi:hypothetical protein